MKKYQVLKTFRGSPDGAHVYDYPQGTTVALPADLGVMAVAEGWAEEVSAGRDSKRKPIRPEHSDLLSLEILAAAEALEVGNDNHWTLDGRPDVRALERVLGYRISAEERDAAWVRDKKTKSGR